ncbi:MAG TPA: PIG-L family deacetylase [Bryobacteraceae bacterium]|nr:PIG-L family deacetylase [Bryobacteraceae bacterium]
MKKIILFVALALSLAAQQKLRVLAIGAHPDDCDIKFGGTAALFAQMGHVVKFLSVTNGDAGHHEMGGGPLARRRYLETQESLKRLGIEEYQVLDNHDGELTPSLEIRRQIIRAIREWKADIVLTHRANDYHPDHRNTGILVQDAAYMVVVPNVVSGTPPLAKNPLFLYYSDNFQRPNSFTPDIVVDIGSVYEKKIDGMDAHVSQFYEWLAWVDGRINEVPKDPKARREWLKSRRSFSATPVTRAAAEKWYGKERAQKLQFVEAFEIGEYGRRPPDEEIRRLFPMLGK